MCRVMIACSLVVLLLACSAVPVVVGGAHASCEAWPGAAWFGAGGCVLGALPLVVHGA